MKPVLLVVYLTGAVCTAWCLSVPNVSRERRPFLSISSIIWPFTLTVFGVLVLLALLAHLYDRMALTPSGGRGDFQASSTAAVTPNTGSDSQTGMQAVRRS